MIQEKRIEGNIEAIPYIEHLSTTDTKNLKSV